MANVTGEAEFSKELHLSKLCSWYCDTGIALGKV